MKFKAFVVIGAVTILGLTACADDNTATQTTVSTPTPSTQQTTQAQELPTGKKPSVLTVTGVPFDKNGNELPTETTTQQFILQQNGGASQK